MRIVMHEGTGTQIARDALTGLGVKVVIVDSLSLAESVRFDRLLLLGGPDIHPGMYGQRLTYANPTNKTRDRIEWTLARRAMVEQVPAMGICRGMQMLSVAHGATLYQDIEQDTGLIHPRTPETLHTLENVAEPLRRHLPKALKIVVNSRHHQAVATVPPWLDVVAESPDGLIEAVWRPGFLGVQWHPELMLPTQPAWLKLFRWLVNGLDAA